MNENWISGRLLGRHLSTPGWPPMSPNVREPNVNGSAGIQTYYATLVTVCMALHANGQGMA